jgi:hypothetical protein
MVMTLRKPRLGPERRGAVGMLADAPRGVAEAFMLAHGFTPETIASLVRDGLATMRPETARTSCGMIEETRVKITDAALRVLEG